MKKLSLLLAVPVLAGLAWVGGSSVASGTDDCVDRDPQHYSWTGGNLDGATPPPPPDGSWQPNTTTEPHLNNPNIVWLDTVGEGLHYAPHGQETVDGEAAWFFFDPGLVCPPPDTTVPPPPSTTEPPPDTTVPPTCADLAADDDPSNDCEPPPCFDPLCPPVDPCPPGSTDPECLPPPPPPDVVPTCEEAPAQAGCEEPPLRVTPPFTG